MGVVLKSKRKIAAELNPPTGVSILGVEVTQAIQNLANQIQFEVKRQLSEVILTHQL